MSVNLRTAGENYIFRIDFLTLGNEDCRVDGLMNNDFRGRYCMMKRLVDCVVSGAPKWSC